MKMKPQNDEELPISYKEIFINKTSNKWTDITINTGGIASTLQDVKAQQRCGGYVYQKQNNRFIYWRTDHDILELVENSLDVELTGNQVRYKFAGSHVLEGISVTETFNSVVILVPTVSSVHRFTFPHPEDVTKQGVKHPLSKSIFSGVNETDASDPKTYRVLSCNPSTVLTGASYLLHSNEAVFTLSTASSSILMVTLDPHGNATTVTLNNESIVPRFLSGITDAILRGKDSSSGSEGSCVSLVLHSFNRDLFLFSLEREGQLRVWSCEKGSCIVTKALADHSGINMIKGQNHRLCKGFDSNGELILCAYIQGSIVVTLKPFFELGGIHFTTLCQALPPPGLEMVDMTIGGSGNIWCSWLTGQELPSVTGFKLPCSEWTKVALAKPALEVKPNSYISLDPAQLHLDAIFSSGFFTSADVGKALSIYRTSAVVSPNIDIREQICSIVESEIYGEVGDVPVDDDEYLEIANRCWSRLYSCCTQYLVSGAAPVGLFWFPSASSLVLIKANGFSLVREMTTLEHLYLTSSDPSQVKSVYADLLNSLRNVEMDKGIERLELALHLGENLESHIVEASKLVNTSDALDYALSILSNVDNQSKVLESLVKELQGPEEFNKPEPEGDSFCSKTGIAAVVATFRDICNLRSQLCMKLLLLLKIHWDHLSTATSYKHLVNLARAYYYLHWTTTVNVDIDTSLIYAFSAAHTSLMLQSIIDSAFSLANALWPQNGLNLLPQHLWTTKNHVTLHAVARLIGSHSWNELLAKSYLEIGEAKKAYDLVMKSGDGTISYYLKAADLFSQYRHPDLVIAVANSALYALEVTPNDLEILYSILFLHELELGHYNEAYSWVQARPNSAGKSDCLHRLIVDMLSNNKLQELLSFPYIGLQNQLEKLLESRARTLAIDSASTYYNLLYALHIKHENVKKAASIMFEHGMRSETTEMQWRCYGACLNALMLVDPTQAWIVRPTGSTDPNQDSIEVLEISDIRREFELAGARYNLGNCQIDATANEVIAMCISNAHYKTAMRLAYLCGLSCVSAVEAFTAACVGLSESSSVPWHWIRHNEVYDVVVTENNASEAAWRILKKLVMKYERQHETILHRAVANKLMELATFLPTWLIVSYKKRNASELLRLYIRHGYLNQASDLAVDYLKAGLGWGKEEFGIEKGLHSTAPPIYLPINIIDLLLLELKQHNMDEELRKVLDDYITTAIRVSDDKKVAAI